MIVNLPKRLMSLDEALVEYINDLRNKEATTQHMLANQEPPDERCRKRVSELSVKLDLSDHANKNLLSMLEQQRLIIEGYERRASEAIPPGRVDVVFSEKPTLKHIDGDAAIKAGREALDRYTEQARQPDRGE